MELERISPVYFIFKSKSSSLAVRLGRLTVTAFYFDLSSVSNSTISCEIKDCNCGPTNYTFCGACLLPLRILSPHDVEIQIA